MKNLNIKLAFALVLSLSFSSLLQAQDIMSRFYQPSKDWQEIQGVDYDFYYQRADYDTITYMAVHPEGKAKGTIIYFHGAGGNMSTYLPLTQPMVQDGYRVFLVDFRGYGKSTGKANHVNVARDAQMIFDKITKRKDVKKKDVIVYGASLGSQVASKIALDNSRKVDALVLDGPMTSFTDIALAYAEEKDHGNIRIFVHSPYSAKECLTELNEVPVLIIHSKEDEGVPFRMGEELFDIKTGAKEMWVYEGEHIQAPVLFPAELMSKLDGMLK